MHEAAYTRGYWATPRSIFVCGSCRDQDGRRHAQQIKSQSRRWPQDSILFAATAAINGYVIPSPLTFDELIGWWLSQPKLPPQERIGIQRLVRKARMRKIRLGVHEVARPAKYETAYVYGWEFGETAPPRGTGRFNPHTDAEIVAVGSTIIVPPSTVYQYNQAVRRPAQGNSTWLLVWMTKRVLFANGRGNYWKGP